MQKAIQSNFRVQLSQASQH